MSEQAERQPVDPAAGRGNCVRTILGDIPLEQLNCAMLHEHVFWDYDPRWRGVCLDFSRQELYKLISAGGRAIVDVAPHPYRIPEWYLSLAAQVDIHIIVSAGFYLERRTPPEFHAYTESQMVDRLLKELTEGIQGSPLKAGVIKVAAESARFTSWEQRVLRAAARVQRETGVPICSHAIEGGVEQFEALCEAGADPERIYICHAETESGWEGRSVSQQIDYLQQITCRGGSLYFSNFGWEFLSQTENLKRLMLTLCAQGFQGRLLFSSDANYKVDETGNTWWEEQCNHPRLPAKNFAYTFTYIVPLLQRWGFTPADLQQFLVINPRAMFNTARL